MTVGRIRVAADRARFIRGPSPGIGAPDGAGPPRFRHINTADSAVGPLHPDALHGQKQAVRVDCGAVPFARRAEDRFTRPGRERTRVELYYQPAHEQYEEVVSSLTMAAAVEV